MSGLLIREEFIAYFPSLAKAVGGIPEAVTLQAIWFKADKRTGELVMKRDDLADYIGASARSLSRYLKTLKNLGVLEYDGRGRTGYDKTTRYRIDVEALNKLSCPIESATSAQNAPTGTAESSGSERSNPPDRSNRVGQAEPKAAHSGQSATMAHSQSATMAHSPSSKNGRISPPTSSQERQPVRTDDEGFSEFWGRYPPTRWKVIEGKTKARGLWFRLTPDERQLVLQALAAYMATPAWADVADVPGPSRWLESEPWLEARYGNLPKPKKERKFYSVDDFKLD